MANSAEPDQLAFLEANWSGSTLFAKAGYIWVQQDKVTVCLLYFQDMAHKGKEKDKGKSPVVSTLMRHWTGKLEKDLYLKPLGPA